MGRLLTASIALMSFLGLLLSLYAVHIEHSKHLDSRYRAHCDLDETIACSHVLLSDYSTGMGGIVKEYLGPNHILNFPNSYVGILFFPVLMMFGLSSSRTILSLGLLTCLVSSISSIYLIYVLVVILQKICLVCFCVHVANFILFFLFLGKLMTSNPHLLAAVVDTKRKTSSCGARSYRISNYRSRQFYY